MFQLKIRYFQADIDVSLAEVGQPRPQTIDPSKNKTTNKNAGIASIRLE